MNLFSQLENVIESIKTGDLKGAVCNGGALFQSVACDRQAAVAPAADAAAPVVLHPAEIREKLKKKSDELLQAAHNSEHLVRTGMASNTAIPSGTWLAFAQAIVQVLEILFAPKPGEPATPAAA